MKKFLVIALNLLMFFALPVLAQNFPLTVPFYGPSFSAAFPSPDSGLLDTNPTNGTTTDKAATYTGVIISSSTKDGKAWFGTADLAYDTILASSVAILDSAVDGGFANLKASTIPESRTSGVLDGQFSREGEAVNDTYDAFLRVSEVGNHRIIAIALFDKSLNATRADADSFFDSVRPATK